MLDSGVSAVAKGGRASNVVFQAASVKVMRGISNASQKGGGYCLTGLAARMRSRSWFSSGGYACAQAADMNTPQTMQLDAIRRHRFV